MAKRLAVSHSLVQQAIIRLPAGSTTIQFLLDIGGTIQIDNSLASTNVTARITAPITLGSSAIFSNYSDSGTVAGAGTLRLDTVTGGDTTLSLAGDNTNANTIGMLAGSATVTKSGVGTWAIESGSYIGTSELPDFAGTRSSRFSF